MPSSPGCVGELEDILYRSKALAVSLSSKKQLLEQRSDRSLVFRLRAYGDCKLGNGDGCGGEVEERRAEDARRSEMRTTF